MMNFKNEEAVSPVIGVILMVAITVILAAVVAAFVFGMTGNVQTTKTVSIGSKINGTGIDLVVNGGADLTTLQSINITVAGTAPDAGKIIVPSNLVAADDGYVKPNDDGDKFQVGNTITIKEVNTGRLLVVGKWSDGGEQIILDRTY